jgi:hypothetical protein
MMGGSGVRGKSELNWVRKISICSRYSRYTTLFKPPNLTSKEKKFNVNSRLLCWQKMDGSPAHS